MEFARVRCALRSDLDRIQVIDSHDHTESLESVQSAENRLFRTLSRSFVKNDLLNTGVTASRWVAAIDKDAVGWAGFKRYMDLCRNTAYFRCFLVAVRDLLEIDVHEITDENWERVSLALAQASRQPDWYDYVLRRSGNIDSVLWDQMYGEAAWPTIDNSLFLPVQRFDKFGDICSSQYRPAFYRDYGVDPTTIADVLDAVDAVVHRACEEGTAAVKIAAAYFRGIRLKECSRAEASRIFSKSPRDIAYSELLAFQDFVYSHVIEQCIFHDLPIQIHTGMLSTSGFLHNGYPLYLEELLWRYPEAKFVLLHASFPFTSQATAIAARHSNVYVDGSWLPILCPSAYRNTLREWLDVLSIERILAWGGDALRVEMTYGSLVLAKDAIADVLAEKVAEREITQQEAGQIADRLLRENLRELFKTDDVKSRRRRGGRTMQQRTERVA
ncbi:MAG: amidohydrolase family protein [Planctomycetes bacterium]|nr:amidohydrolase family protein [Planctomycetota bacterium]